MVYQIKRNHIVEQLEIEDNGKTLVLGVDINVDQILSRYNKAGYAMAMAQKAASTANNREELDKAEEMMGEAVLALFEVIFGEEQTKQIIEFYENRALEMLADISPFIADVVQPKIAEAQQRITDRYKQTLKAPRRK